MHNIYPNTYYIALTLDSIYLYLFTNNANISMILRL